jgi:hypothetical protein
MGGRCGARNASPRRRSSRSCFNEHHAAGDGDWKIRQTGAIHPHGLTTASSWPTQHKVDVWRIAGDCARLLGYDAEDISAPLSVSPRLTEGHDECQLRRPYCAAPVTLVPISQSHTLVIMGGADKVLCVDAKVVSALRACRGIKLLQEHLQSLSTSGIASSVDELSQIVETLLTEDLLCERANPTPGAKGLSVAVPPTHERSSPLTIAVVTADRPHLDFEDRIVGLAERHIGDGDYLQCAVAQLHAAFGFSGVSRDATACEREAARFRSELCQLFGVDDDICQVLSNSDVAVLVSATPVLRSLMFFTSNVRRYPLSLARGTRMLIGLQVLASLARTAGMQEIRYQTVTHLFRELNQLLELLSLLDSRAELANDVVLPWSLGESGSYNQAYLSLMRDLIRMSRPASGKLFGDVLRKHLDPGDIGHVSLLKAIARALDGSVHPSDAPPVSQRWRMVAKARLQQ